MGIPSIASCYVFASSPELLAEKKAQLLELFDKSNKLPRGQFSPRLTFSDTCIRFEGGAFSSRLVKHNQRSCFVAGNMLDVNDLYSDEEKIACLGIFRQGLESGLCQSLHVPVRRKGRFFGMPFTDLTLIASMDFAMLDLLKFYSHLDEARMDDIGDVVKALSEMSPKLEFPMAGWKALEKQALTDLRFARCIKRSSIR
jgi:hypothetical protein